MVKFHNKKIAILASFLVILFASCQEKDLYNPQVPEEEGDQPSLNDYSTIQRVKFNLNYDVPEGYIAPFEVYDQNPLKEDEDGRLILKNGIAPISGGISISGNYNISKTIPSYATELYVYSSSLFVPTLMKASIQNGIANFEQVNLNSSTSVQSSSPTTRTLGDKKPDYYLRYEGGVAKTFYDEKNNLLIREAMGPNHEPCIAFHKAVPAGVYNKINAAFPEKVKVDPKYLSGTSVYLEKASEMWISIIHTDGTQWDNTLGYFYHDGDISDLIHEQREELTNKEIIAIPLAKLKATDSSLSLVSGDYVQLKYFNETTQEWENEFPAGLTIGWILHYNCYDRVNRRITPNWEWPLNSISTLNTDNHRIDCVVFNAGTEEDPFICVGFEDDYRRNTSGADEDFNDIMFHIITNPTDAIGTNPPPIPPVEGLETTVTKKGILAFEDNWPNEGDYDLNDVVVKYNSKATLFCKSGENETYLQKLEDTFSIIHNGGILPSKFGYKINIDPSYVLSIEINGESYSPVADNFDNSGFIVDLCENIQGLPNPGRYESNATPFDYIVVIEFKDGITEAQWEAACAPYNPFITPKANTEVHLPFYSPTNRADLSLFNTEHDKSDISSKRYYISGEKLYPFAIHLSEAEHFINLNEKERIDVSYPKYKLWVESNGTTNQDWYK